MTLVKYAPMGDPMELRIHGFDLTLRLADAEKIEVRPATDDDPGRFTRAAKEGAPDVVLPRPDYGEDAIGREAPDALPEGTTLTFALVGNQNCGKTTLFNQLTGSNQHVGNFPGVTVDRKDGAIRECRHRRHALLAHLPHMRHLRREAPREQGAPEDLAHRPHPHRQVDGHTLLHRHHAHGVHELH